MLHRVAGESPPPLRLPRIAFVLTNRHLRPFLSRWHTALRQYEDSCPPDRGVIEHEHLWPKAGDMRAQLADLQGPLAATAAELADLCGIDLQTPEDP